MVNLKTYFGGTKLPKTISTSRYSCVFFTWKKFIKSALIYKRSGKQKKTHQSKSFKFFFTDPLDRWYPVRTKKQKKVSLVHFHNISPGIKICPKHVTLFSSTALSGISSLVPEFAFTDTLPLRTTPEPNQTSPETLRLSSSTILGMDLNRLRKLATCLLTKIQTKKENDKHLVWDTIF